MIEKILNYTYENNVKKINEVIDKVNEITEVGSGAKFVGINSDNQDEVNFSGDGATGNNAIAIGTGTKSKNTDSVAIGTKTEAVSSCTVAIGEKAKAQDIDSIAIGSKTKAQGNDSISIGTKTKAQGSNAVAIGTQAKASGDNTVAIGNNATIAIGLLANADFNGLSSIALGSNSIADEDYVLSVGHKTYTDEDTGNQVDELKRRIINVADGINDTDVATINQLHQCVPIMAVGNEANKIPVYNAEGHLVLPDGTEIYGADLENEEEYYLL